jgi:hypothetical protein
MTPRRRESVARHDAARGDQKVQTKPAEIRVTEPDWSHAVNPRSFS